MRKRLMFARLGSPLLAFAIANSAFHLCPAGGVTIITHGYNSDVNTWITGMTDQIPDYEIFPGTNFTTYKLTITFDGSSYFYQWSRTIGSLPSENESGEIIIKLDWSEAAGGLSAPFNRSTYEVASVVSWALLQTNLISELGGRALAEFPLHLLGHSRGGSLVSEMSRLLGMEGVWVDHLTTLDPHPLNNDGFVDPPFVVDASVRTYSNVLFHDNYWQDFGLGSFFADPNGEPVAGAYQRKLYDVSGGYGGLSGAHSDVHLWYHGTIDFRVPANDTGASITESERLNWWTAHETRGNYAGFHYSLIGRGDRLSTAQPAGPGLGMVRDGYNQNWELGAGTSANRAPLPSNNGNWPNLVKFNRTATNGVVQGQSTPLRIYYQWARPGTNLATISIYLDADLNPFNSNQTLLREIAIPGNGASSVSILTTNIALFSTNALAGDHTFLATITGDGRTRWLYAPEFIEIISINQPPTLEIQELGSARLGISVNGLPGQTVVLQNSTDLRIWLPLATNTLTTDRWVYTNTPHASPGQGFYRAVLP